MKKKGHQFDRNNIGNGLTSYRRYTKVQRENFLFTEAVTLGSICPPWAGETKGRSWCQNLKVCRKKLLELGRGPHRRKCWLLPGAGTSEKIWRGWSGVCNNGKIWNQLPTARADSFCWHCWQDMKEQVYSSSYSPTALQLSSGAPTSRVWQGIAGKQKIWFSVF